MPKPACIPRCLTLWAGLGLLPGASGAALAQALGADQDEQLYAVEVIVFEHLEPGSPELATSLAPGAAESGGDPAATAQTAADVPTFADTAPPASDDTLEGSLPVTEEPPLFVPLVSEELKLRDLYRRLSNSQRYAPIIHLGWSQRAESGAAANPYPIEQVRPGSQLRGSVSLRLERFLHLRLDLAYEVPEGIFELKQTRRLRSGELHYFDDPRFGVIAQITPSEGLPLLFEPEPAPAPGASLSEETSADPNLGIDGDPGD